MNRSIYKTSIFILLVVTSLFAEEGTKLIAWKPIPDANGYQIQIKEKSGKLVLDKKINTPYHSIEELPSGIYVVRTAPLNLFKKPAVWSNWKDLEIIISEPPQIVKEVEKPIILPKTESNQEKIISPVTIQGEHFLDATKVDLSKKDVQLPIVSKEVKSSERIELKVDTTDAISGPYDLTVTNPYQKPKVVKNFVQVEEQKTDSNMDPKLSTKDNLEEIKKNERVKSNLDHTDQSSKSMNTAKQNSIPKSQDPSNIPTKQSTNVATNKQKITLPKGKPFRDYSYEEMLVFLETDVAVNCKNTKIPALTLSECHKTYVILNFSSEDNQSVFEFYKLVSENETNRISAYRYFSNHCDPKFRPAMERMELQWKNRTNLDPEERQSLAEELPKFRACTR